MEIIIIVLLLLFIFELVLIRKAHSKNEDQAKQIKSLSEINEKLSVFEKCVDADAEAKRIISDANKDVSILMDLAEEDIAKLKTEAQEILSNSKLTESSVRIKVAELKEKAENTYADAVRQTSIIIATAEAKAKEIAGDAYEIAKNAKHYEQIAKAMKNLIEGYGDEYLKPTFSLLDDLAEEFGFDEAGQKLKEARSFTQILIKKGEAASCDYVEQNRKTTAINFVLDAFNGKVDSIISLIKKDNYGVLEQKIKDAYTVVNNLGQAFRNARINEIYLDARLAELKWGFVVVALKLKEKEEQRLIKERIREEERARREYEKAMRDAVKEEDSIRKAMEKTQAEIAKATDEQKEKYEAMLEELKTKLTEAEAKNQRAISMAQQTRSGHVYIISNIGSFGEDVFKIGMTRRLEPIDRIKELGDASVPFPFDVHAMIYSDDAPSLETDLHKFFAQNQVNKVNPRKEFFKVSISDIKKEVETRNENVKWTLLSEAAEYRESLAIEKALISNPEMKENWVKTQDRIASFDDEIEENE